MRNYDLAGVRRVLSLLLEEARWDSSGPTGYSVVEINDRAILFDKWMIKELEQLINKLDEEVIKV